MDWKIGLEAIEDGEKAEEESGREKGFAAAAAAAAEAAEGEEAEGTPAAVAVVAASAAGAFVKTM